MADNRGQGFKDYYAVLGVNRDSFTKEELKNRFRTLAKEFHPDTTELPDKGEAKRRMQEVNEAILV